MIKVQSSLTAPKDSPGLSSGMGFLSSGKGVQIGCKRTTFDSETKMSNKCINTGCYLLAQDLQKDWVVFQSISAMEVSYMVAFILEGIGFLNTSPFKPRFPYLRKLIPTVLKEIWALRV